MKNKNLLLERIADHLVLNSPFLANIGLYHGIMGVILFFAHYSRYKQSVYYEKLVEDLFSDLYEDICDDTPVNFENGLSGIGWGILYLLKNDFVDGNADIILKGIDNKLRSVNVKYINDFSLGRGLQGMYHYISMRIQCANHFSFDDEYISEWNAVKDRAGLRVDFDVNALLANFVNTEFESVGPELGLCNGYAGYGLMLLKS